MLRGGLTFEFSTKEATVLKCTRLTLQLAVATIILAGCSSGTTSADHVYGPSGHQFSVAFPSVPQTQANTSGLLAGGPAGSKAYGYEVSRDAQIFSAAALPVPRPPTYAVIVIVMPSTRIAKNYLQTLSQTPGVVPFAVRGLSGYRFVGSERRINDASRLSDPSASEGVLFVGRGATLYVVEVITAHLADAKAFLSSFRTV
jgi:hypothetical protein